MNTRKLASCAAFCALILASLSCKFLFPDKTPIVALESPIPEEETTGGSFSSVQFCLEITDDGECLEPADQFPAGTMRVWAIFTYQNMENGQPWGRIWENEGKVIVNATGESWEDGAEGWLAYVYSEEYALEGQYTLSLYIDDALVEQASFDVEAEPPVEEISFPAFGPVDFSASQEVDTAALQSSSEFAYGILKLYGYFPFVNIPEGQSWSCEWLRDGNPLVKLDLVWDTSADGVTYCSFEDNGGEQLEPGIYTLNLYLDGQVARSAQTHVLNPDYQSGNIPPASPEDVISPELMKAWKMLDSANMEAVHYFAQLALKYHITAGIDENMTWYGGVYHVDDCTAEPRLPGKISFSRKFFDKSPWETVAALLAHELVHASQHMEKGQCGCYLYNEVQAYEAQIITYKAVGQEDLIYERWGQVFGDDGRFDQDLLWKWVDEQYDCPAYAP